MKGIWGKIAGIVLGMLCFCIPLWSCAMFEASDKKVSDMDFTVVNPEVLSEEIRKMIEERKRMLFRWHIMMGVIHILSLAMGSRKLPGTALR